MVAPARRREGVGEGASVPFTVMGSRILLGALGQLDNGAASDGSMSLSRVVVKIRSRSGGIRRNRGGGGASVSRFRATERLRAVSRR